MNLCSSLVVMSLFITCILCPQENIQIRQISDPKELIIPSQGRVGLSKVQRLGGQILKYTSDIMEALDGIKGSLEEFKQGTGEKDKHATTEMNAFDMAIPILRVIAESLQSSAEKLEMENPQADEEGSVSSQLSLILAEEKSRQQTMIKLHQLSFLRVQVLSDKLKKVCP